LSITLLFFIFSLLFSIMDKQKSYNWLKVILMGIAASIANNASISVSFNSGLYLDTIFTVAAVFAGGLVPGLISAVLTTVIYGTLYFIENGTPYFGANYLYIFCSITMVLLVRLFAYFFQTECESVRVIGGQSKPYNGKILQGPLLIMLTILSLVMSFVISVMGGLISARITSVTGVVDKSGWFRLGFIMQGFSLTASEILARIPVNIADKTIAVFGGYGIALLIKRAKSRYQRAKEEKRSAS